MREQMWLIEARFKSVGGPWIPQAMEPFMESADAEAKVDQLRQRNTLSEWRTRRYGAEPSPEPEAAPRGCDAEHDDCVMAMAIIKVECAGCKTVDYVDSKHKRPSTWYLGAEGKNYCPSCADKICKVDSEDTANVPIYIDDLLLGLIEECGEVIQAATKCLRFGYTTEGPHDYGYNHVKLSEELGDVLGIIDALPMKNVKAMENMRSSKIERMKKAKVWHRANGDAASLKR